MNKFLKTFIKVVYYILALAFGVVLVLTLPYIVLNSKLTKQMNDHLENKEFVDAMHLIGCYYDSEIAYYHEQDNFQLVLFRATPFVDSVFETKDESGNDVSITSQETLKVGYFGFLNNVGEVYNVDSSKENDEYENKTKIVINDSHEIEILDYDSSQNGKIDSVLTMLNGSYVTFSILNDSLTSIEKIEFIDKEGKTFFVSNVKNSNYGALTFDHKFFVEFNKFVPRYNELIKNNTLGLKTEEELINEQKSLEALATEIINNNTGFVVGKYEKAINDAQFKSYLISILYFIGVFLLGDLLVGKKTTIVIVKKIFSPITKKIAAKKIPESKELNDYYSQTVITLIVPEDFEGQASLSLFMEDKEESFDFIKDNEYISKKRIHAGIYDKLVFTCDGYKVLDLPEFVEVKGFKTELKLKIEKE